MTGAKPIRRSSGANQAERLLSDLCDRTFLRLWAYANPYREDGKELCDLIAVFEKDVFLFFIRDSRILENTEKDISVLWSRWEKEAVLKQITSARGAERYVRSRQGGLFLDAKRSAKLPIDIPAGDLRIHKIVVALGAADACRGASEHNVYGSLGAQYSSKEDDSKTPFIVSLDKDDPVHVFDEVNLQIVLEELDTIYDLRTYLVAKEDAIRRFDTLAYCGEEDLLAHYLLNFDSASNKNIIGSARERFDFVMIGEGEWKDFSASRPYKIRKEANKQSYLWDRIIQRTSENAFNGTLGGERDIFNSPSVIKEMAKEPRFSRRALSTAMHEAAMNFPAPSSELMRNLSVMPSFYGEKKFVLLQFHDPEMYKDYAKYREARQALLLLACGVVRNKFSSLKKVVGIAVEPPKFHRVVAEDFLLLDCENWSDEDRAHYDELNEEIRFLESPSLTSNLRTVRNFPLRPGKDRLRRFSQNEKCPCGSGRKFKNCHGR